MSHNRRTHREAVFYDNVFGADDGSRKAAGKYYSACERTYAFYRHLVTSYCKGRRLLEYGCGMGSDSIFWARSGAAVTGIDISNEGIKKAREHALNEGVNVAYYVMNAEDLQFEESSFDVVVGTGILHHLNSTAAYAELSRVLTKDGHAIFIEPMGYNPLINLYRKYTPAIRTEDERPLLLEDIQLARRYFHGVNARFFNLFTLLAVPFRKTMGFDVLVGVFDLIDRRVFAILPFLKKYAWMVVLDLSRPNKISDDSMSTSGGE